MRVRIAQQARADLDGIWIYVAKESDSQAFATRVIESITDKFRILAKYPLIGRSLESELRPQIRTFVADHYLIFYSPRGEELRILRVIHASRGAFALFGGE